MRKRSYTLSSAVPVTVPSHFRDMSHWPYPSGIYAALSMRPSIWLLGHVVGLYW
jgi:hypothetical protein